MKTEIEAFVCRNGNCSKIGTFTSLSEARKNYEQFSHQQTFEDIDDMDLSIPYLHIMEYRDEEHYNDLYFTMDEFLGKVSESDTNEDIDNDTEYRNEREYNFQNAWR